jgi:hypothetical protein
MSSTMLENITSHHYTNTDMTDGIWLYKAVEKQIQYMLSNFRILEGAIVENISRSNHWVDIGLGIQT